VRLSGIAEIENGEAVNVAGYKSGGAVKSHVIGGSKTSDLGERDGGGGSRDVVDQQSRGGVGNEKEVAEDVDSRR